MYFKKKSSLILERERNNDWLPPICVLTGDRTHSLGMWPDQKLNPQSFVVWDDAPTNWAPGQGEYTSYYGFQSQKFESYSSRLQVSWGKRSSILNSVLLYTQQLNIVPGNYNRHSINICCLTIQCTFLYY